MEMPQSIEAPRNRKVDFYTYVDHQDQELGRSNTVVYKALLWDNNLTREVALKIFEEPNTNPSMINEMLYAQR